MRLRWWLPRDPPRPAEAEAEFEERIRLLV